jgi:hypothetical protein
MSQQSSIGLDALEMKLKVEALEAKNQILDGKLKNQDLKSQIRIFAAEKQGEEASEKIASLEKRNATMIMGMNGLEGRIAKLEKKKEEEFEVGMGCFQNSRMLKKEYKIL